MYVDAILRYVPLPLHVLRLPRLSLTSKSNRKLICMCTGSGIDINSSALSSECSTFPRYLRFPSFETQLENTLTR